MKFVSHAIHNFFDEPDLVKDQINEMECMDIKVEDGVTYPNIVNLHGTAVGKLVEQGIYQFYPDAECTKIFARYTKQFEEPPHWAHSDRDMTEMIAMIYLNKNEVSETHLVEHRVYGFKTHPKTMVEKLSMKKDSNVFSKWYINQTIKGYYNDCLILNADYLHAAGPGFGTTRENTRCVVTCFFNVSEKVPDPQTQG